MNTLQFAVCLIVCALAGTVIGMALSTPNLGFVIGLATGAAIAGVLIALSDGSDMGTDFDGTQPPDRMP
jgi:uncharacterized membrane protein